jgi:glycosyltransferase involved in cell wall biosynthesis
MKQKHILILSWGYPKHKQKGNPFVKETAIALYNFGYNVSVVDFYFFGWSKLFSVLFCKSIDCESDENIKKFTFNIFNPLHGRFFSKQRLKVYLQKRVEKTFKSWIAINGKPDCIQQHFILHSTPYITQYISEKFDIPYVLFEHSPLHSQAQFLRKISGCTNKFMDKNEIINFAKNAKFRVSPSLKWSRIYGQYYNSQFETINGFILQSLIDLPKKFTSQTREITLINVGTINDNKGSIILLEAVKLIKEFKIHLIYCGGGPYEKKLKENINNIPENIRVTITGFVDRTSVIQHIDISDFLIIASENETFGNTAIEALGRGVPVLSTKCGGPEEIIKPFCGDFFEKRTPQEIKNGIIAAIERKEQFDPFEIKSYYQSRFSEEFICGQINDLYCQYVW